MTDAAADSTAPDQAEETPPPEGSPAWWEWRQPDWAKSLNRFCENWIFAFIIAMCIRQGFIEAYRIPTASMEPMLYGDPALTKGDFVAVDKFFFRFTGPERWGVTVFQYPWPEIEGPGGVTEPLGAYTVDSEPTDNLINKPLIHRNFVKRCVALPGDRFFVRGGDIQVQQADGSWLVPEKPDDLLAHLWQDIYIHADAPSYAADPVDPAWKGVDGGSFTVANDEFTLSPGAGAIRFQQALRNLYLKQGDVAVNSKTRVGGNKQVNVSLTQPQFTLDDGTKGNVWDYGSWNIYRLRSDDLDNTSHHSLLNDAMREFVGDLRISCEVIDVPGTLILRQREGIRQTIELELAPAGWQLRLQLADAETRILAEGKEPPTGRWSLQQMDDRVWVEHQGDMLGERHQVPAVDCDPVSGQSVIEIAGTGTSRIADLRISRDVHYCRSGILVDARAEWKHLNAKLKEVTAQLSLDGIRGGNRTHGQIRNERRRLEAVRVQFLRNRRGFIEQLVDEQLRSRLLKQLAAVEQGLTRSKGTEWLQPLGISPETAIEVPADGYLLMGDNSPFSFDSRNWGWVPGTNLRGTVLVSVQFPFGRWQLVR